MLGKGFENKVENVIVLLHKSILHPNLEYCVQFWFPGDLEKSQRRAAKMTVDVKWLLYLENMNRWGLFSLKESPLMRAMTDNLLYLQSHEWSGA